MNNITKDKAVPINQSISTWPDYPTFPNQNDHITTSISYLNPMPNILTIEVNDKVLFYYIRDNAIYYATYEKGHPIVFKWTYDLDEIFKVVGLL